MELLCVNLVTLALVVRLNSAWTSHFSWTFLAIWGGGLIASLIAWVFVLYIPRRGLSSASHLFAGFFDLLNV